MLRDKLSDMSEVSRLKDVKAAELFQSSSSCLVVPMQVFNSC